MEKVSFNFALSEEAQQEKQKNVKKLVKNKYVKQWMKKKCVDESYVYNHSGRFIDYVEVMEKCEDCKGLDFCRQPLKGQRLQLFLDGMLMNIVCSCDYYHEDVIKKEHIKYFYEHDIANQYLEIDVFNLDLSKESLEYKAIYEKVIDIISGEKNKGLFLWGKPGSGKTYLAAGIANHFAKQKKYIAFVNVPKFIADLKMLFHDHDAMEKKINRIKKADVLILDDIGGESVTAWSRDDILLPLLDARMEHHKLTLFTSNYCMKELKERLTLTSNKISEPVAAERLFERIKTISEEVFLKGESRRK